MLRDKGIHPDLRRIARFLPPTVVTPRTVRIVRALQSLPIRGARDVEVLTLTSGQRARVHRPPDQKGAAPALLWIHGGGYVIGVPRQDDAACQVFSRDLGITVAATEYRRAPEHHYPAALEDCYAALRWLVSLPSVDSARVAIGGASAGAGLAAALAFMIRDRGEIAPVLQLLRYPMLDDRTVAKPAVAQAYRLWNQRSNRFG
jgi:acetyl esterase/lipase